MGIGCFYVVWVFQYDHQSVAVVIAGTGHSTGQGCPYAVAFMQFDVGAGVVATIAFAKGANYLTNIGALLSGFGLATVCFVKGDFMLQKYRNRFSSVSLRSNEYTKKIVAADAGGDSDGGKHATSHHHGWPRHWMDPG